MKKILTLLMITGLVWSSQIQAQVSISTTCDDPDASSMLDVQSTDKGMLVPRMTATQMGNIASPATGLLVFNTTANEFYYFDGTNWMPFNTDTTDGDAWDVTGEDQTSAIERTGDVGIGISPSKKLTVYDDSDLQTVFYGYSVVGDVSTIASGSIQIGNKNQFHATIDYNCDDTTCFTIGNTYDDDEAAINFRMRAYGTPVNAMTIKGTGNVGIGTTVPTNALHINKDSDPLRLENLLQQSTDSILVVTGDGVVKYMSGSSVGNDGDAWGVTGEDQTTNIGRTGWVGIGTLSPQEFLHVYDGDIIIDINSGSTESFDDLFFAVDGTICNSIATYKVNNNLDLTTDIPGTVGMGDIVFRTHGYNNPRMIVTYEGNVGIGTTSPDASAILELSSTNQGFLITRNDTANIVNPAFGLETLQSSDSCKYMWSGSKWIGQGGVGAHCSCNCNEKIDTDGDGVPDEVDIDDDNDGILDTDEGDGATDTDGDGTPDSLDSDSDNDGVSDLIEGNDANHDGVADSTPSGNDTDGDGLDDTFDTDNGGAAVGLQDTDGDGTKDFQDTDDDNDGTATNGADSSSTGEGTGDQDNDGKPNYLDDTITQTTCGTAYDYKEVTNPSTGDTWLDRNLGSGQVATAKDDYLSYGSMYQWGRLSDDHQCITFTSSTSGTPDNGVISTLSSTDDPGTNRFIKNDVANYDWRDPKNDNLWQGVNGINNPCPSGFRLPTETELDNERLSWSSNDENGAYASPLKFTLGGRRSFNYGSVTHVGSYGHYWTSTITGTDSRQLRIGGGTGIIDDHRAGGANVRCIKD
jgi:hypothetical protein